MSTLATAIARPSTLVKNSMSGTAHIGDRVLLPTFKLATLVSVEPDGREIYKDDSSGHLLCEHGERASTICTWILNEKMAALNQAPVPARSSTCTCQTTEGMHKTHLAQQNAGPSPAPPAVSLFEHLTALDTDRQCFKGREARHIPFTRNQYTTYITQDGKMLCKHGRARMTLQWDGKQTRKHGRVPRAACGCLACPIPKRAGHHLMKLGACGDRRLTKTCISQR